MIWMDGQKRNQRAVPLHGQLTVEALMLGALALSLLIIAALAISRLQAGQADLFSRRTLQTELEGLGRYVDEICVLGEGNARTMALADMPMELQSDAAAGALSVGRGSWKESRKTICPVEVDHGAAYGATAYLWYEPTTAGGPGVRISPTPHP